MTKPAALSSSELIDFIAERITQVADWREGFGDLLEFVNMRLATGSGFIRLYHYISHRYLEPVSVRARQGNALVDAVFDQMVDERKPLGLPVEYSSYLAGEMQYAVVGVPFQKNGEYLGGLVLAGTEGEGIRESQFQNLIVAAHYLLPLFESAVLQEILLSNYLDAIDTLAVALEAKDPYTRGHSNMVCAYAVATARKMGFRAKRLQSIEIGAMMHDIGKIGVPDSILQNTGKLTPEEFEVVKRHPVIGEEILRPMKHPLFNVPRQIVRWHHERIDGKGYPDGLKGEEIPLEARITFVADAYEAMTSERPFRSAKSQEEAMAELRRNAGTQFDPDVVDVLCGLLTPTGPRDEKGDEEDNPKD
jgi:HD-GYP domain-containing protein (c-di-GMP phosphodiesterase class II)